MNARHTRSLPAVVVLLLAAACTSRGGGREGRPVSDCSGSRRRGPPCPQAHLLKGRGMDVSSVLGREPAMYIGGSWVAAEGTRPVINPADESVIAAVPEGGAEHAERALEAARRAHREWSRRSGPERGAV